MEAEQTIEPKMTRKMIEDTYLPRPKWRWTHPLDSYSERKLWKRNMAIFQVVAAIRDALLKHYGKKEGYR